MSSSSNIVNSSYRRDQNLHEIDFNLETETTTTPERNRPLANNLLGKELQSALKPINIVQEIFFCAKYKIRDNIITTNSLFYNIVSVFAFTLVAWGSYHFAYATVSNYDARGNTSCRKTIKTYVFLTLCFGSLLNCCISIILSFSNTLFVIKIQAIYSYFNIIDYFKRMVLPNWACVLSLLFYHIVWTIFSYCVIDFMDLNWGLLFTTFVWLSFDVNILCATRILKLVTKSLKSWVEKVAMPENLQYSEIEGYWRFMFKIYMEIMEAYKLFGKNFQHLILFYVLILTSKSLICIWMRIETKKVSTTSDAYFALLSFFSLTWIIKNTLLFILLSIESEKIFSALKEVQSICTQVTNSSDCSIAQKRVCKNIQRFQKTSFKKMHLCGLFTIDAALSLRLCALITTYTIVIVQFELL